MEKPWLKDPSEPLTKPIIEDLKTLWADPSLKNAYENNEVYFCFVFCVFFFILFYFIFLLLVLVLVLVF